MLITSVNSQCFEMRPAVKTGKGKKKSVSDSDGNPSGYN